MEKEGGFILKLVEGKIYRKHVYLHIKIIKIMLSRKDPLNQSIVSRVFESHG